MLRCADPNWLRLAICAAVFASAGWPTLAGAELDSVATLVGQVTCSACWSEADRTVVPYGGEADVACAARCAAAGIPPAIAVRGDDGSFRLVELEGPPPGPHATWLDLIAVFVRADTVSAGDDTVRVTSLQRLEESPWPASAARHPDELSWPDLTGAEQSLATLRGRVVVVNFWATWCTPCVEEMPVLNAIQTDYAPFGVQVIGISADAADRRDEVLAFARETRVTFPVWLGATAVDMASFEVGPALPATVVIDREGHVVHRVHGMVEGPELREVLDRVLHGGGPAEAATAKLETDDRQARASTEVSLVPS
jgi:thiol-disulfide isomerase/thioredoxin